MGRWLLLPEGYGDRLAMGWDGVDFCVVWWVVNIEDISLERSGPDIDGVVLLERMRQFLMLAW